MFSGVKATRLFELLAFGGLWLVGSPEWTVALMHILGP